MAVRREHETTTGQPAPDAEPVIPARVRALLAAEIQAGDGDAIEAAAVALDLSDEAAELVAFVRGGGELRRWPYARRGRTYAEHIANGGRPPSPSTEGTR